MQNIAQSNLDPVLAYDILVGAGLIQAPVIAQDDDKDDEWELLGLFTFAPDKDGGHR